MITSEANSRGYLNDISLTFKRFRETINEDDDDSCLCQGCLKKCNSMLLNECNKGYDKFLCYVDDTNVEGPKCTTAASNKFCDKCQVDEGQFKIV